MICNTTIKMIPNQNINMKQIFNIGDAVKYSLNGELYTIIKILPNNKIYDDVNNKNEPAQYLVKHKHTGWEFTPWEKRLIKLDDYIDNFEPLQYD